MASATPSAPRGEALPGPLSVGRAATGAGDLAGPGVARVTRVRNAKAVLGVLFGLLALAILIAGGLRTNSETTVDRIVVASIPVGFVAGWIAVSFARRGRFEFQRTLGRTGGRRIAGLARALGILAILLSLTGALAIAVFGVLKLVA